MTRSGHAIGVSILVAFALVAGAGPATPQSFDVPDGFDVVDDATIGPDGDWRGLVQVLPEPGPFSDLSRISLREVAGDVDDPAAWLNSRMAVEIGARAAAEALVASPDSPFGDPMFDGLREALPGLFSGLDRLAKMPLDFCEGPAESYNASGALQELYCVFSVGPFRQFIVLRLQEVDDRWYYTEVRAMNERRLRHLLAIANSFSK